VTLAGATLVATGSLQDRGALGVTLAGASLTARATFGSAALARRLRLAGRAPGVLRLQGRALSKLTIGGRL
jgi:hypothetical protein